MGVMHMPIPNRKLTAGMFEKLLIRGGIRPGLVPSTAHVCSASPKFNIVSAFLSRTISVWQHCQVDPLFALQQFILFQRVNDNHLHSGGLERVMGGRFAYGH